MTHADHESSDPGEPLIPWSLLLETIRSRLKVSRRELAKRIGVTATSVKRWEEGNSLSKPNERAVIALFDEVFSPDDPGEPFSFRCGRATAELVVEGNGKNDKAIYTSVRDVLPNMPLNSFLWELFATGRFGSVKPYPGEIEHSFRHMRHVYKVQDFGEVFRPGDVRTIRLEVEMFGAFSADTEGFTFRVSAPMDHLVLSVTLPKKPKSEAAFRSYRRVMYAPTSEIDTELLLDQHYKLVWTVSQPKLYATYSVTWTW